MGIAFKIITIKILIEKNSGNTEKYKGQETITHKPTFQR